jgi:membrane protein
LGTSGKDTAADWIMSAVESVQSKLTLGRIGPIGLIVLIWTALTLLTTVEQSLNRIFEAPRSRPFLKRMLLYWSAVTLVPLIIAAAGYAADVAANALHNMPVLHFIVSVAGGVSNFVVGLIALGVIYKVMPNTRTHFRASAGGAFVAMILWVIVGWGFAIYVRKLVGPGNIYGTLGLLPLSLFWLNLVWLIFLFGAQLSFTWANLRRMEAAELARTITVGPVELLAGALVVARHYASGSGPIAFDQIVNNLGLPGQTVHQIMQHLISLGLVYPVEQANEDQTDQKYLLAEPTEKISVLAVTAFLPASDTQMQTQCFDPWVAKRVAQVERRLRSKLGDYTLADVLAELDD